MKSIVVLFALAMVGSASAEAKTPCKLPLYIEAAHETAPSTTDSTASMFVYGLQAAVKLHQGCIVDSMADAHLGLFITTLKIGSDGGPSDSSVIAVALAVPLNGIPVYVDDYVLVIRDSDSVEGRVNGLLESIGETLDRHSAPGH